MSSRSSTTQNSQIHIPYSELDGIGLYVLGSEENKQDSYVNIVSQDLHRNGLPHPGGIYDAHMGTTDHTWDCATCLHGKKYCPGHEGVIHLKYPVPSPLFMKHVVKWLKVVCFNCGKLVIPERPMKVSKKSMLAEYVKLVRQADKNVKCVHCDAIHPHIVKDKADYTSVWMEFYEARATSTAKGKKTDDIPLYPHQMATIFAKVSPETVELLGQASASHPSKLILSALRAPPNTIRPDIKKIGGGRSNNNDLTILLQAIVKINDKLPDSIPKKIDENLATDINLLAMAVYELIKGTPAGSNKRGIVTSSKKPPMSISKRLPRKEGRIRQNLNGRRANHMARSFITCDPSLRIDEVGIPQSVAKNIQIPEIVRDYNMKQMEIYFMNGVDRYPGCSMIQKARTGSRHWVGRVNTRFSLEPGDIIFRDLRDGDQVNFNRQPSLESSSITSMKAKIVDGMTIRMNVLACPLFNADFDGDAMNLLFCQSNRTIHEITNLAGVGQFFISYKNASPKIGEAQDSLLGIAELTRGVVKIDKYHMMGLFSQMDVYPSFSEDSTDKIYNGRDAVTKLLRETGNYINLSRSAKMYDTMQAPYRKYDPTDIKVEINRGELVTGVLDQATVGEGARGGVFHIIHNEFGPAAALEASWNIQQLALAYLFNYGFTTSARDFVIKEECLEEIHKIESRLIAESQQISRRLNEGKIIPPIGKTIEEYFEDMQMNALDPGDEFWEHILSGIDFDNNNFYKMVLVGSRGKLSNFKNVASAIGQLKINGQRMEEIFGQRVLPYFMKHDMDPRSRGYVANSYMTGLTAEEFIFHAMDARFALINKALSTSITGEQNRRAIKNLESHITDNMRKVTKNKRIIQLLYGGDGVDARFIERVLFQTAKMSDEELNNYFRVKVSVFGAKWSSAQKIIDEQVDQLIKDRDYYRELFIGLERTSGKVFTDQATMPVNVLRIVEDVVYNLELASFSSKTNIGKKLDPVRAVEKTNKLCKNLVYILLNEIQEKAQNPVPHYMTEATTLLQILVRQNLAVANLIRNGITDTALDIVIKQIRTTYLKSLISYGRAVGILAAQSISEPMTQMVLDAHHRSGAGGTKKTGMFRIKEILGARPTEKMTSPSMLLQVKSQYRENKTKVQEIGNHIEMLELSRFVDRWQLFYEKYGEPEHPSYSHEKKMIQEFEKYHKHIKPPSDLARWCIRLNLNKSKLILKQMKIETIYNTLRDKFSATHIVYSTDNANEIIMRIYIRNVMAKKGHIGTEDMRELVLNILNTVVRGVPGIIAAYVQSQNITVVDPKTKAVESKTVYQIFTEGTNVEKILENPYIDPLSVQSDSIQEMADVFGIECARVKVLNELRAQVDAASYRHYTIYADEMTYNGMVTSIDRYGSAKRDSNFMLRISDASPVGVIEDSALNASHARLSGVSAPIMVGKNPEIGDLYNTFKLDMSFVKEQMTDLDKLLDDL